MRAPNSTSFSSVFASVTRLAAQFRAIGERRRVIHNLASLDDYMLRDIGLTRSDVDAASMASPLTDGTLVLADRAREDPPGSALHGAGGPGPGVTILPAASWAPSASPDMLRNDE